MMDPHDVVAVLDALDIAGVVSWLDRGWGVDALVGEQTREHADLDLVIARDQVWLAVVTLQPLGFTVAEDALPSHLVLHAPVDRRIDFHPVVFDDAGGGLQQLPDGAIFRYPPEGFAGAGRIGARSVRCLTPEVQLLCHLGHQITDICLHDMRLLRDRLGLVLPPSFQEG